MTPDFDTMIQPYDEEIQSCAHWMRTLLLSRFPDLREDIHGGAKVGIALYSDGQERVCFGIQPSSNHVKLYLHHLDDYQTDAFKLEGKGKDSRHIKFFSIVALEKERDLLEVMRTAVAQT